MSFTNFWKRRWSSARRRAGGSRRSGCPQFSKLALECLEHRRMLQGFAWYPTTFQDNDPNYAPLQGAYAKPTTLRDCILQANYDYATTGQPDIIYLSSNGGTYTLSIANPPGTPDAGGYALCITAPMSIASNWYASYIRPTIIQQTQQDRVFEITSSASGVSIFAVFDSSGLPLVIEGGRAVDQPNPTGPAYGPDYALGGGIYDDGSELWLSGVEITKNTAIGSNGTAAAPDGQPAMGGGIYCYGGSVSLAGDVQIVGNEAEGGAGAPGAVGIPAGNGGAAEGGGICAADGAQVGLYRPPTQAWATARTGIGAVSGNIAAGGPGGGDAPTPGAGGEADGGGVYLDDSSLDIPVTFNGVPVTSSGEGLQVEANVVRGGACGLGEFTAGHTAGGAAQGGGIFAFDGASVTLTKPTISSNVAFAGQGTLGSALGYGRTGLASGGGIFADNATVNLTYGSIGYNGALGASAGRTAVADGGFAVGGGIALEGPTTLTALATWIGYNWAEGGPGFGSAFGNADSAQGGTAYGGGLAIQADSSGNAPVVALNGGTIVYNQATGGPGGNGVATASPNPGSAGGDGAGGGLYDTAGAGSDTFVGLIVTNNTAQGGAGGNGANGGDGGVGGNGSGGGIYDTGNTGSAGQTFAGLTAKFNLAKGGAGGSGAGLGAGGTGGDADGGGLLADGPLILNYHGVLDGNKATGGAGGRGGSGSAPGGGGEGGRAEGGGLFSLMGDIWLTGTMVNANSAKGGAGGAGGWCAAAGGTGQSGGEGGSAEGGALFLTGQKVRGPTFLVTASLPLLSDNSAQGGAGGAGGQGGNGGFGGGPGAGGPGGEGGEADGGALLVGGGYTMNLGGSLILGNMAWGGWGGAGGAGGTDFPSANGAMGPGGPGGNAWGGGAYVQNQAALDISTSSLIVNFALGGPAGTGKPPGFAGVGTCNQYYCEPAGTVYLWHVAVIPHN